MQRKSQKFRVNTELIIINNGLAAWQWHSLFGFDYHLTQRQVDS
jgi:hypothetical protein